MFGCVTRINHIEFTALNRNSRLKVLKGLLQHFDGLLSDELAEKLWGVSN